MGEESEVEAVWLGDQPFQRRKGDAWESLPVVVFKIIESDADYGMFFENKRGSLPNLQSGVAGGAFLKFKNILKFFSGGSENYEYAENYQSAKNHFFFCALFKIKKSVNDQSSQNCQIPAVRKSENKSDQIDRGSDAEAVLPSPLSLLIKNKTDRQHDNRPDEHCVVIGRIKD